MRKFDAVYPRAIEILLGIMGNMVMTSVDTSLKLVENKAFVHYLLFNILISMSDVQTVIQVTRLLSLFLMDWTDDQDGKEEEGEGTRLQQRKIVKEKFVAILKSIHKEEDDEEESEVNWQILVEKFFFILEQSLNATLLDSLFDELANSTRNREAAKTTTQSATSTTLAEAIEQNMSQMSNFNLAKTFMKDLFLNLEELKSENDVTLNRIFENCVRLLNDE
jgi:hypothetical protein